jgi:hypothetical protein
LAGSRNSKWQVKLKAKFNDALHPEVVATVYGWWQACQELKLSGTIRSIPMAQTQTS